MVSRVTDRLPNRLSLAVVLALTAFVGTGCFQFSDTVAFRNATEEPLVLSAGVDGEFAQYDCDGDGSDLIRFQGETQVEVQPGRRICLEGPVTSQEEPYDARDLLLAVEIARSGSICVELEGDALRDRFSVEGFHKTMRLDDETCPAM